MKFIELFCGIGGFRLGLSRLSEGVCVRLTGEDYRIKKERARRNG